MIYLSESAIKYAVNICEELPGYKVGIALLSNKYDDNIEYVMRDTITDIDARFCINGNGLKRIEFNNGSIIQFIPTSDSVRGYAFNLLIVEYNLDKEFVNRVLQPYEKIDY